jgi:hypothetical protein
MPSLRTPTGVERRSRVLHGLDLRVVARTLPQDEAIVEAGDGTVALVHLTWSGREGWAGCEPLRRVRRLWLRSEAL